LKSLLVVVVVALASLGIVAAFMGLQFVNSAPGSGAQTVVYEVVPGTSFRTVAQKLEAQGIVTSAWKLRLLGKITGLSSRMKRGEYALDQGLRPTQVLEILASGKSITHPLTVPEGWNMYDIAAEYEKKGFGSAAQFLSACREPMFIRSLIGETAGSLEGYLYPETYMITKYTSAKELIGQMVKNFLKVYGELTQGLKPELSRQQIVTLASIVERETGAPEERPLIASIFFNRLHKGMRLQSDPTILYGILEQTGQMKMNITRADIMAPTPYNTYTVAALPKGPIANPGREALAAVLKPAQSQYFYFVSRNDGTHIFSTTYEAHSAMVRKFQLDPKAREGKSWRDLSKRESPPIAH
jgi:UPF0755 protein